MQFTPSLFSTRVQNGRRTFFIDVKCAKDSKPYVKIVESTTTQDGQKKTSHMTILDNEINDFKQVLDQACAFINQVS
jgi:hypothetical protein